MPPPESTDPRIAARSREALLETVFRWGPWIAGLFLFVMATTATAAVQYATTKGEFAVMRADLSAVVQRLERLEEARPHEKEQASALARDVANLQGTTSAEASRSAEVLRRISGVEKFLARLVCKQSPADPFCAEAVSLLGQ